MIGNRRFSTDQVGQFYPFGKNQQTTLTQRATGLIRRSYVNPPNTFDAAKWEEAAAEADGSLQRRRLHLRPGAPDHGAGSEHATQSARSTCAGRSTRDLRPSSTASRSSATTYTHESCIREQIVLAPGQVFNRNYLLRSYQNIGNLNFFETPMAAPETRPSGEQGDVDIVFHVKEKRTGNVNFGASMGQGTGLGGFIGLDQPNLLGRCKRAQLQWQFGRYINDFNATYTDPNIRQIPHFGEPDGVSQPVPLPASPSWAGRFVRAARCSLASRFRVRCTLASSSRTAARR